MAARTDPAIRITAAEDGSATLHWEPGPATGGLSRAIGGAVEQALSSGLHRVEATLPADDRAGRVALLRAGFRQEGVRRQAARLPGGDRADLVLYARLADDRVDGPHGFTAVMNSALPRKRLIAHVVIRDEAGRVLLCETTFKTDWELPGGIVEPGESPRDGAIREVREELGVDHPVGRLLTVDWLPPYLGWEDACELIFDGGVITESDLDRFVPDQHEIAAVRLCTLTEAAELVTEAGHRRLVAACSVPDGESAYLEHGIRV